MSFLSAYKCKYVSKKKQKREAVRQSGPGWDQSPRCRINQETLDGSKHERTGNLLLPWRSLAVPQTGNWRVEVVNVWDLMLLCNNFLMRGTEAANSYSCSNLTSLTSLLHFMGNEKNLKDPFKTHTWYYFYFETRSLMFILWRSMTSLLVRSQSGSSIKTRETNRQTLGKFVLTNWYLLHMQLSGRECHQNILYLFKHDNCWLIVHSVLCECITGL